MPKKLVIFDIPLIVDLIASFLPAKDIKTCCKINRGWNTLFSPHMWREIRLVDISRRTPESNQALSRNARFIRRLQIDLMADASLLLDAHCNQLQRLSCLWDRFRARELKDKRYAQLCYDGDIEMFDVSSTPMQLIVMNPGLRKLEIACHESELGLFLDQPVLASIARCHRLAYLSLHVTGTLNQKILQDLLPNIPRTCHFFELSLKDLLRMASQGPSSRLVFEPSFQLPFKTIRFLGTIHSPDVTEVLLPMTYGYVAADMTLTLLGYCKHITKLHVPSVADDMWSTPTWRESEAAHGADWLEEATRFYEKEGSKTNVEMHSGSCSCTGN
ncbi:hypothetical protein BGZ52_010201 [Haplosporangium bisporale]|nr:hypothetical protein BGZ52_010201 [Haplosporangium bisporale]